ncbi:hypothetical protein K5V07_09030 [Flavobacterium sp. CHNK8]|uniref:hypothetical protein n=1 Tax=Flavobacterium sp. CHNK8 TaxID=2871165 RepID=UPI001C8E374F|nr:hypothetical protein [Flavobacterium sp. CHNK8]QZK90626.1 hypothetical protein K5V07_09030 [Flavobacterium sp. CHNK8]
MKLYALKAKYGTYQSMIQALYPERVKSYYGISYREDEDFSESIKTLKFRIALDHNDRKNPNLKYIGTDFYNGPNIINNETGGYNLDFYTVSPKMKEVLEHLNLPKHRFYPIMLTIDKGKELTYFILQIDSSMIPYTDVSKSSFYGLDLKLKQVHHYEIGTFKTEEEIDEKIPSDIFVRDKSMYINQELDWVYMAPYFMISEKSKKLFEEHNLIDLEITPFYEMGAGMYNELGFRKEYGGREIIINGRSTMDGLDINDFERKEE